MNQGYQVKKSKRKVWGAQQIPPWAVISPAMAPPGSHLAVQCDLQPPFVQRLLELHRRHVDAEANVGGTQLPVLRRSGEKEGGVKEWGGKWILEMKWNTRILLLRMKHFPGENNWDTWRLQTDHGGGGRSSTSSTSGAPRSHLDSELDWDHPGRLDRAGADAEGGKGDGDTHRVISRGKVTNAMD